ncbi:MAG: hypothetical protein VX512_06125 [Pseudomonadota bacterium]|nr:hypothetical protein [Pseudomonadota bacterium]
MSRRFRFAFDNDGRSDADLLDERARDLLARMAIARYDARTDDLFELLHCVRGDAQGPTV